jgi:hypothetical protein
MIKQKTIKLIYKKGTLPLDFIDDIPVTIFKPFSINKVRMLINPDIKESKDTGELRGIKGGRITTAGKRKGKTQELTFDFQSNNSHTVILNEITYKMTLDRITNTKDKTEELMIYEFNFSDIS